MEYFGKNTLEQVILDFLDQQKENRNLSTQELIGKINKVVEYYRESLMYEFDESEYPSTLEMMREDTVPKIEEN
ncbi:MAG: hypothetical protein R8G33_01775 [Gammaproteobacteria bacterium]|nr:hypothetical protein [Gammaproteobacteria bacterium]